MWSRSSVSSAADRLNRAKRSASCRARVSSRPRTWYALLMPSGGPDLPRLAQVNETGFPLQLTVEAALRDTYRNGRGWDVIATEFPINDGFVDLVIRRGQLVALLECKRPLDDDWIFLVRGDPPTQTKCCLLEIFEQARENSGRNPVRCAALTFQPESFEAEFCCLPRKRPLRMLEDAARTLVLAAHSIAGLPSMDHEGDTWEPFVPIIVTTARLVVCGVSARPAGLDSGLLESASFQEVPFVRFRKSLVQYAADPGRDQEERVALEKWKEDRERTVFVVRAHKILDLLNSFCHAPARPQFDPLS